MKTIYQAEDGTEFQTQNACEEYETAYRRVMSELGRVEDFLSFHDKNPDKPLTDRRKATIVRIVTEWEQWKATLQA